MSFDHQFASIQALLSAEERETAKKGMSALAERLARRQAIRTQLSQLIAEIERETARLNQLPALPELACLRWTQSLQAFPNGRILTVDTVFPGESAELLQILVLDFAGCVRLHRCVATGYALSPGEMVHFGISHQDKQEALPLPQIWPQLLDALHGCYVLVCDLRWTRMILEQEAHRFQLEVPVLIGEDLLRKAIHFYQESGRTNLTSLCGLIGYSLSPNAPIIERARGQLALLEAMAQGNTGAIGGEG